jgi:hypothetical protein
VSQSATQSTDEKDFIRKKLISFMEKVNSQKQSFTLIRGTTRKTLIISTQAF